MLRLMPLYLRGFFSNKRRETITTRHQHRHQNKPQQQPPSAATSLHHEDQHEGQVYLWKRRWRSPLWLEYPLSSIVININRESADSMKLHNIASLHEWEATWLEKMTQEKWQYECQYLMTSHSWVDNKLRRWNKYDKNVKWHSHEVSSQIIQRK